MEAIAIPKADVQAWTQLSQDKSKVRAIAIPSVVVTYLNLKDKGIWLREQCGESPVTASTAPVSTTATKPTSISKTATR